MEEDHLNTLLICKQQVLFHFYTYYLDADGLRDFIIFHSQYNLVQERMQSKERYFVPHNQSLLDIPKDIVNLFICCYGNTLNRLVFSQSFSELKSIEIGNECFQHVREFVIDGLESLESVKIGEKCFRISEKERDDGICRITNCPNLRQLEMGDYSFEDFKSFEISNLNSIQSINFGDWCFQNMEDFSLKGEWK